MKTASAHLSRRLTAVEYFTFGFGSMIGVGWVVLIDDWLARGGPAGAMLGFAAGGLLLLPVARTYGRLVREIPDAGAEIAYAEGVFPRSVSFAAAWTMVLAYAIVCPWEAVAIGNLLSRVFPAMNSLPLYSLAGKTIFAPRLAAGLLLTAAIASVNFRGIRPSGLFQDITTFGLLAIFALFTALGFAKGDLSNWQPLFARPGAGGAWLSVLLVLQIVPYFMTGFESIGKESEEARPGFDPRHFGRAILAAAGIGCLFYVTIVAVASFVFPWRQLVAGHLGTEAAFERAFGSRAIARMIVFAAFLSLLKVFNGNFVASTRLLFGIGKRDLVHPALSRVDPVHGTPGNAILLMALLTGAASFLGDALLVPITEVGSLAVGVGWLSACLAFIARSRRPGASATVSDRALALSGALVAAAIVAMKIVPSVPGSFTRAEWIAFALWSGLGLFFWQGRKRPPRPGLSAGIGSRVA
ncbi:MAG TPA: APC family permease [Thermoanaerobaculia bacterium]